MRIDWVVVCVGVVAMSGCRQPSCHDLKERQDYLSTATVCAREYERSGDPADAISAAEAYDKLHRDDQALELASHLLNGPYGPNARRIIARIYLRRRQFDLARPLLEEALRLDQGRGDHAGAYTDAAALVTEYWKRSDFGTALKLADIACSEARASGVRDLHAASLISLASVYQSAGDNTRALDGYTQATSELPPGDLSGRARVLIGRGVILKDQRQYALARPLLAEAGTLAAAVGEFSVVLAAEVNLSDIALDRRDLDAAAHHLDNAQAAWQARGDEKPSRGILINRAVLERYRGNFPAATRAIDAAAAADPSPESAWIIAYERGQLAATRHDADAAERNYLTAIGIIEEMWRTSSPEELKAPFFEDRWLPYQSLFASRVERKDPEAAFASLISAQGRMFLSETIVRSASPGASAERRLRLRSMTPLVANSSLARSLGPSETLAVLRGLYVLDYFAGDGRMRLLVINDGKVRLTSVNIQVADLEKLIDDFLARPDDRAAAEALGDALLPADVLASAPTRFHIIPDGPLLRVPFAALAAGGSRLVEHHEIAYAPSATALASSSRIAATPTTSAVLLSDARNDLRHSAEETASVLAATDAYPRTGHQASIAALRSAQDASLLHIIGHSGVDTDGGYLFLADGHVTAADILAWHIRPRLVVLPTCASAATYRRDMWGSLAVAFLAAGSVDVVATMFSIEDETASEFTRLFYRSNGVLDPVGATAVAQRKIAAHRPASAWSAFMVIGL